MGIYGTIINTQGRWPVAWLWPTVDVESTTKRWIVDDRIKHIKRSTIDPPMIELNQLYIIYISSK